jgi:hypothetical protein
MRALGPCLLLASQSFWVVGAILRLIRHVQRQ